VSVASGTACLDRFPARRTGKVYGVHWN